MEGCGQVRVHSCANVKQWSCDSIDGGGSATSRSSYWKWTLTVDGAPAGMAVGLGANHATPWPRAPAADWSHAVPLPLKTGATAAAPSESARHRPCTVGRDRSNRGGGQPGTACIALCCATIRTSIVGVDGVDGSDSSSFQGDDSSCGINAMDTAMMSSIAP